MKPTSHSEDTKVRLPEVWEVTPPPPQQEGGWVYVAVNPAWPGWVKIGQTREPDRRLRQYQTSSPHRDWAFVACLKFKDHHNAERLLLERLATRHEWAEIDSFFATRKLEELHNKEK